jgi:hypothetical protein
MLPHRWGKRLKTYESVQRWLCRFVFVVCAILPTLGLLACWTWSLTPWYRAEVRNAWNSRLSLSLGVDIKIGDVAHVSPKHFRFTNIEAFHPESGELLGRIDRADVNQHAKRWSARIASLRCDIKSVSFLASKFHERCLCQPNLGIPEFDSSVNHLELTSDGQSIEEFSVVSKLVCDVNRSVGEFQYRLLREKELFGRVDVERFHAIASPITRTIVNTGESKISNWLMSAIHPAAHWLGPNATFQGEFTWLHDKDNWNASVSGAFDKVAWSHLCDLLNTKLIGQGRVDLQESLVANGQLMHARGSLSSQAGRIERDWLRRSEEWLGIGVMRDVVQGNSDTVPFEKMGLAFQIDGAGLYLQGAIPARQANVAPSLMADGRDGIVYAREPSECVTIDRLYSWLTSRLVASNVNPVQPATHQSVVGSVQSNPTSQWLSKVLPTQQAIQLASPTTPEKIQR